MKFEAFIRRCIVTALLVGMIILLQSFFTNVEIIETYFAKGFIRSVLEWISIFTSTIRFSIAEIIIGCFVLSIVISLIQLIYFVIHFKIWKTFSLLHHWVNSILLLLVVSNLIITPLYYRESSFKHLSLNQEVTLDNALAVETANFYIDYIKNLSTQITRDVVGNVVNPYTLEELDSKLKVELVKLHEQDDYFALVNAKAKPVWASTVLSYLGIAGIYFPFTQEANINVNTSPFQMATTVAHELAHTIGVLRENEANFIAYYVTLTSEDPYLNYSGAMSAIRVMLNQLEKGDYDQVVATIPTEIIAEYNRSYEYYQQYNSFISDISNRINDFYLKSSGIGDGVKSYSRTAVELTALYQYLAAN